MRARAVSDAQYRRIRPNRVVPSVNCAHTTRACAAARLRRARARGAPPSARPRARSVSVSTVSPERRLAFVSPSVTYGPKRPFLTTIGLPLTGSAPSSRSGAAASARRPRCFGWASSASASSSVSVKQLLLGLERARVGALASRTARSGRSRRRPPRRRRGRCPTMRGSDEQRQRVLERHRLRRHRLEERGGARLLAVPRRPRSRTGRSGRS